MNPADDASPPAPARAREAQKESAQKESAEKAPAIIQPADPDGGDHLLFDPAFEHVDIGTKVLNALAIGIPFIGIIVAIVLLWGKGIGALELTLMGIFYVITAGGVTLGFHRYFTHKSFECPRWVQWLLGIGASMSVQGPLLGWVATHRCHHQHSDRPGDPHSPHVDHDHEHMGGGFVGLLKGYWHSHMGWLFNDNPANLIRYIPDLKDDYVARTVSRLFVVWVAIGLILPGVIAGLITMSWKGFWMGCLWGGLVRLFLVHHVTWSINSACHLWGARTYKSHDHSRNNVLFGILALGEGWHNNHHAFPTSARHGLEWWQLDLTYITIWTMKKLGLAWDVKIPPQARRDAKRVGEAVVGEHGKPITYTPPTH